MSDVACALPHLHAVRGDVRARDRPRGRGGACRSAATRTTTSRAATSARRATRCRTCTTIPIGSGFRSGAERTAGSGSGGTRRSTTSRRGCCAIQRAHGRDAVGLYPAIPTVPSPGRDADDGPAVRGARHAQPLLGDVGRSAAAHAGGAADVRAPAAAPGARHRSHAVLPVLGANPLASNGSLMTAPGIRQRLEALRARGGRLVVVDPRRTRDGRDRRRAPLHPARHRRLAAARAAARAVRRRARAPGASRRSPTGSTSWRATWQRLHAGARRGRRRASPPTTSARLARDFAAAPRAVVYGRVGVCTQAFGGLSRVAHQRAQHRHRQPRSRGRRDVHDAGGRPRCALAAAPAFRGHVRALPLARARAARVRRRAAGRRRWPRRSRRRATGRSARWSRTRATRCCRRPTARGSTRALPALDFMVCDRPLPQRDHAPRAPHPAAGRPLERGTTTWRSTRWRSATSPTSRRRCSRRRRARATTGRPCPGSSRG